MTTRIVKVAEARVEEISAGSNAGDHEDTVKVYVRWDGPTEDFQVVELVVPAGQLSLRQHLDVEIVARGM